VICIVPATYETHLAISARQNTTLTLMPWGSQLGARFTVPDIDIASFHGMKTAITLTLQGRALTIIGLENYMFASKTDVQNEVTLRDCSFEAIAIAGRGGFSYPQF
jgi:hypothetical protein